MDTSGPISPEKKREWIGNGPVNEPPCFPPLSQRSGWHAIKESLLSGALVGFPAEFAYALSEIPAKRPQGLDERIHRVKNRPSEKPILYLAGSLEIVARYAWIPSDPKRTRLLLRTAFTTYLFHARPLATSLGMAKNGKVAFRIPPDRVLRSFLLYLNQPISGTSLNRSGSPPLKSPGEIREVFPNLPIIDGGIRPGKPVSPILDLTSFDHRMIRGAWSAAIRRTRKE